MCYTVFIATSTPQQTSEFIPDVTKLYLKLPEEKDLEGLKDKLKLPHIYYVGADTQCSCGFEFHSEYFDDPEWQDSKASPQALLYLLVELTAQNDVEYYCCWNGDFDEQIEYNRTINIREISLEKNYFELAEGEFIRFTSKNI